jgi:hypothetical protein
MNDFQKHALHLWRPIDLPTQQSTAPMQLALKQGMVWVLDMAVDSAPRINTRLYPDNPQVQMEAVDHMMNIAHYVPKMPIMNKNQDFHPIITITHVFMVGGAVFLRQLQSIP